MSQGQSYQAHMLENEREVTRVIDKAMIEIITPEEAALLRWATGISTKKGS